MKNLILAVILARSGSKGIKNKNIKILNGKPLIAWSIATCLKSKRINKIVVSKTQNTQRLKKSLVLMK